MLKYMQVEWNHVSSYLQCHALLYGFVSYQGVIQPGSDADIVIWDPEATRVISKDTHHQVRIHYRMMQNNHQASSLQFRHRDFHIYQYQLALSTQLKPHNYQYVHANVLYISNCFKKSSGFHYKSRVKVHLVPLISYPHLK